MTREEHMALEAAVQKVRERVEAIEEESIVLARLLRRLEDELLEARPQ